MSGGPSFLPGTASLVEEVDKKLLVVLRDGRKLIGILRSFDQFANVVLENCIERIYVKDLYGDIPLGLYVIRGENVVLIGEIDLEREASLGLRKVPASEIKALHKSEQQAKEAQEQAKRKILMNRGFSFDPVDLASDLLGMAEARKAKAELDACAYFVSSLPSEAPAATLNCMRAGRPSFSRLYSSRIPLGSMELVIPQAAHPSSKALIALSSLLPSGSVKLSHGAAVAEPVLKASGADIVGPVAISRKLVEAAKQPALAGAGSEEAEVNKWLAWAASFAATDAAKAEASLKELDHELLSKVFLVGHQLTLADLFVYSAIYSSLEKLNNVERFAICNATRWFDHVQHTPSFESVREHLPLLHIKRNVASILAEKAALEKGKPAKADKPAAPAATAAPAADAGAAKAEKPAAKPKPKQDKAPAPAAEAAPAPAPAAAAKPAESKPAAEKAEKAEKEGKAPAKAKQEAQPKGKGKGGKGEAAPAAAAGPVQSDISRLDIRVGKILEVAKHTENLYVEKIDLGEEKPRTIVSGLVKFVPIEHMQNRFVLVLANLPPRALQGVTSEGMVLAASDDAHTTVELPDLPDGVKPGERVYFQDDDGQPELPHVNKKALERVFPDLVSNAELLATYKGNPFLTSKGPVKFKSLKNAHIK